MNVLVTGAAGFIGSHLVDYLMEHPNFGIVIGVDNLASGLKKNVEHHLEDPRFIFEEYDISRGDASNTLHYWINRHDVDVVFHLAAVPGVPFSVKYPKASHTSNDLTTLNVLEGARKGGAKRVVFSSSSSIYGGTKSFPTVEAENAYMDFNPKSPYAQFKATGEQFCKMYTNVYGIDTACLRYFNIFGPRQRADSAYAAVIASFIDCAVNDKTPKIHGDGTQFRDFTYVSNAVYANVLAAINVDFIGGESFNVGTGSMISVNDIHKASGAPEAEYVESRAGDVHGSQASIEKLKRVLGYDVLVDFDEGMKRTIEWHLEEQKKKL